MKEHDKWKYNLIQILQQDSGSPILVGSREEQGNPADNSRSVNVEDMS